MWCFSTSFYKWNLIFIGYIQINLPKSRPSSYDTTLLAFISNLFPTIKNYIFWLIFLYFLKKLLIDLLVPTSNIVKTITISYVIYYYCSISITIIWISNCSKSLLTCRIPLYYYIFTNTSFTLSPSQSTIFVNYINFIIRNRPLWYLINYSEIYLPILYTFCTENLIRRHDFPTPLFPIRSILRL